MKKILFNDLRKLVVKGVSESIYNSDDEIISFLETLKKAGYILSKKGIDMLRKTVDIKNFYKETLDLLNSERFSYNRIMYQNFPNVSISSDDSVAYAISVLLYLGEVSLIDFPNAKPFVDEGVKLTVLDIIEEKDIDKELIQYSKRMLGSNVVIPESKKDSLISIIDSYGDDAIPNEMPFKENCIFALNTLYAKGIEKDYIYKNNLKTLPDVLRFVASISAGDITLAEPTHYRNFKRSERRFILKLLESVSKTSGFNDNLVQYANRVVRLCEKLHPGEYSYICPNFLNAVNKIRNNEHIMTFNSALEKGLKEESNDVIELLAKKPGEFARRLDVLLRKNFDKTLVKSTFEKIVGKLTDEMLLSLWKNYLVRNNDKNFRSFILKGHSAKVKTIENNLSKLDESDIEWLITSFKNELTRRFSLKESLGKVYLDEELKSLAIPSNNRTESTGKKVTPRGSRFKIEDGSILRVFTHWVNPIKDGCEEPTDIDLAAVFLDKNFEYLREVSWRNHGNNDNFKFSGDVRTAPRNSQDPLFKGLLGGCEYLDIDVKNIKNNEIKYIVITNSMFSGLTFKETEECFSGIMIRKDLNNGDLYEPQSVKTKLNLTGESTTSVCGVIDLEKMEFISIDSNGGNCLCAGEDPLTLAITRKVVESGVISLYDLFKLHVDARGGVITDNKDEADIIISDSQDATLNPYDSATIISEWL